MTSPVHSPCPAHMALSSRILQSNKIMVLCRNSLREEHNAKWQENQDYIFDPLVTV